MVSAEEICSRCVEKPAVVKTRKELFCKECFSKFILLKQRRSLISDKDKFLETVMKVTYKTPNDDKLLLALSFGKSSLVVLQNLIEYLNNQYLQQQKTGFILETITVVENDAEYEKFKEILNTLTALPEFKILNKGSIKFKVVNINSLFDTKYLSSLRLNTTNYKLFVEDVYETDSKTSLGDILVEAFGNQNKTLSSKEDFTSIAINNVIQKVFEDYNYKALIYGSSMTKLATDIVTNTVIGRGDIIAKNLDSKFYPLTDVFYSEVEAYYDLLIGNNDILLKGDEKKTSTSILLNNGPVSEIQKKSKQTKSISDITLEYFNTIEGDYANVISTVVKTGLKLGDPNAANDKDGSFKTCKICNSKISKTQDPADWINKITVVDPAPITTDSEKANTENWKAENTLNNTSEDSCINQPENALCYGCAVTLNTSAVKTIKWTGKNSNDSLLDKVLEDYIL